ncbi:ABC-2 transporter permease [Virgibacillus sp. NKC19-16]|uniref:ABC-2 transporter permease n=1 Tax=Virgibacillus salidurans TaxID=2831673 RepID=UPI001F38F270|nr:ABC-2 transporter permease [Virgibacillus sp. NKC19-16]UJL46309.1 ABC-2 transporter permease [Virgibacillus sp. NKC19-16]
MKGLLLNQYYSIEKSIWNYVPLGLIIATILIFFDNHMVQRLAAFMPILFMASAALEVLKQEAKSGWNKYVLTLPVKRNRVVQSHYLFFTILTLTGLLIAFAAFVLAQGIFGQTPGASYINAAMHILGITLTMGFVVYPLTYLLGTEKAEVVLAAGGVSGLGVFFLSTFVYQLFIMPLDVLQGVNHDLFFALSFLIINFILFVVSYVVSIQIYKRKEV